MCIRDRFDSYLEHWNLFSCSLPCCQATTMTNQYFSVEWLVLGNFLESSKVLCFVCIVYFFHEGSSKPGIFNFKARNNNYHVWGIGVKTEKNKCTILCVRGRLLITIELKWSFFLFICWFFTKGWLDFVAVFGIKHSQFHNHRQV